MFISIGGTCNVKYQIDIYSGKKETMFFDWLFTDMNSVITILNYYNNIDELLYIDNIIQDPINGFHNEDVRVIIKSLSFCVSIHDFGHNINNEKILNFIDKYKRRLNRIINYINTNEKIYFIKYGNISIDEKNKFIEIIKNINKNCNFVLISLIDENYDNYILYKDENYLQLNIHKYLIPGIEKSWTTSEYDWKNIFNDIIYLI